MSTGKETVTYEAIAPLIAASTDDASGVEVTFRCPVTGMEVRSNGYWPEDGLAGRTAGQVKRGLLSSVRNTLARTVRDAVTSNSAIASIGTDATSQIIYNAGNDQVNRTHHSDNDRHAAQRSAFTTIADRFVWDDNTSRFVSSNSPTVHVSEFDALVGANPIANQFDADLAARLIGAIIASDGTVSDDERSSFASLFPSRSLDQLVAGRVPGRVDFEETTPGAGRETMLLLAWAVALTDERLSAEELAILTAAADGLGIDAARADVLSMVARGHVIDQAIVASVAGGADLDTVRSRCEDLGEQIGLGRDEAARAFIRWSKRSG